jgi:hypothetical protein
MEINSVSPDGNYKLETDSTEFRMSHWVNRPRFSDVCQGELILDLGGTGWDVMNFAWKPGKLLWMELRKYPGDCPNIAVTVNLVSRRVVCPQFECDAGDTLKNLDRFYQENRQHS